MPCDRIAAQGKRQMNQAVAQRAETKYDWLRTLMVASALSFVSACGDGGGAPTNSPPAFSSPSTVTFEENGTGAVYRPAANDPEGQTIQFAIAGGADASKFALTNGELHFISTPDFDAPGDADGDNVYEVGISASDGTATSFLALKVTVTNSKEGIAVRRVATGFTDPVAISPFSESIALIAEAGGAVYEINPQTGSKTLLTTIPGLAPKGLMAMTASNNYHNDGSFFVLYLNQNGWVLLEKYVRGLSSTWQSSNFGPVLGFPSATNPGGWLQQLGSTLLIGIGDPSSQAQDESFFGKLIKATANPDPYAGAAPAFFLFSRQAKGLHQPVGAIPTATGWLVLDRGGTIADEINLLDADKAPVNFGWPAKEGTAVIAGASVPPGSLDPALEIPRKTTGATGSGIVGVGASGAGSALDGKYVFAERGGAIYTVDVPALLKGEARTIASLQRRDDDFTPDVGKIEHPVALTNGQGNFIYILDEDGEVFRVN